VLEIVGTAVVDVVAAFVLVDLGAVVVGGVPACPEPEHAAAPSASPAVTTAAMIRLLRSPR
jgi:hypothetical protein